MNPLFMQRVMNQASQMMQQFQNPQQLISRMMPGIPEGIRNDPNQIISWMQQTGKITPEQIRMAQQMMGR
jgi:hypothetical protein